MGQTIKPQQHNHSHSTSILRPDQDAQTQGYPLRPQGGAAAPLTILPYWLLPITSIVTDRCCKMVSARAAERCSIGRGKLKVRHRERGRASCGESVSTYV